MALVNQPTAAPTRKWWALVIGGVLVNACYGAMDVMWPDHPFTPYKGEIIGWATVAVSAIAAYFTRNKANAPVVNGVGVEELDIGSGGGAATPVVRVDEEKPRQDGARKQAPKRQTRKVN